MSNSAPIWAIETAAQAWCTPATSGVVMDSRLAMEFARLLSAEREACAITAERLPLSVIYAHKCGEKISFAIRCRGRD